MSRFAPTILEKEHDRIPPAGVHSQLKPLDLHLHGDCINGEISNALEFR